ncbi:MAG TPA: hypothetical protein PLB18_13865 [Acidobacteriota bacterium]|nr:hypothetical protein [Acidobacteriota bacterium]HND20459.1 hypothetical protein [Acidobacteriota bacterium]
MTLVSPTVLCPICDQPDTWDPQTGICRKCNPGKGKQTTPEILQAFEKIDRRVVSQGKINQIITLSGLTLCFVFLYFGFVLFAAGWMTLVLFGPQWLSSDYCPQCRRKSPLGSSRKGKFCRFCGTQLRND